jgi:hypothetical protein
VSATDKQMKPTGFGRIFSKRLPVELAEFDETRATIAGIYAVSFQTKQHEFGSGIAVVTDDGKLGGGDARYYYSATLREEDGLTFGEVEVVNYQGDQNSVLGALGKFRLKLSGRASGSAFTLAGQLLENPAVVINLVFKKLRDF